MEKKRTVYLKMKPLAEAREILFDAFPGFGTAPTETVPAHEAAGRILAEPVFAELSSPHFHAAAMDGVAVKAETTYGAAETRPKSLRIGTDAVFVNTGHPLPEGTDAVIMVEDLHEIEPGLVSIEAPVFPWRNVRKLGEDIVATELLFPRNHRVTPYCIGALLGGGVFEVPVRKRPRLAILPTGNELFDWRRESPDTLAPGRVVESNSYVMAAMARECGGEPVKVPALPDDFETLRDAVRSAVAASDIVATVGGSSAGSEDYTREVIRDLGEILVHGVTIMPGKPVLIGRIDGKPVLGMPGYPVSMIVAFEQFVAPLVHRMLGRAEPRRRRIPTETTRKVPSKLGTEEFIRVKLGRVGDRMVATPLPRGAGSISTITEADGILRVPASSEGMDAHETAEVELLRPEWELERTLVAVGSHDNTLDLLADALKAGPGGFSLSSSHVGSMGGLMALRRGVCHFAGSHLLDTADGSYNVSYVERYLKDVPVRIVHLVMRDQGLIVAPGNPKGIAGIESLTREDVAFINRQGGSGTRILLDYRLGQLGMAPEEIAGYANEEFTHMAVAAAVASGTADAGLGILAAAKALKLDLS
jgi:putative molybdopterin biosynthesis protein